ncbi:MAG: acyltransferase [Rickettsiales bacterium]|jgi:peptidoglycan/LPS O-acetylase OafA/YrhL|nr:acyltransferase [Rickettsiales bacterium]
MKKLYAIDFWRVLMTILIIWFHYRTGAAREVLKLNGGLMVSMFFIMAGFFMWRAVGRDSVAAYIKDRWLRLAPPAILVLAIAAAAFHYPWSSVASGAGMLGIFGEKVFQNWTPFWYIWALFWSQIILFAFVKLSDNKDRALFWIATLSIIGITAMFAENNWGGHTKYGFGFITIGMIRGICWTGAGMILARADEVLRFAKTRAAGVWFSIAEIAAAAWLIFELLFGATRGNPRLEMLALAAFAWILISHKNNLGVLSRAMNKWSFWGRASAYCYTAFVCQELIGKWLKHWAEPWSKLAMLAICAFGFAVFYERVAAPRFRRMIGKK